MSTTLRATGGGVDVTTTAHNVDVGGHRQQQSTTIAAAADSVGKSHEAADILSLKRGPAPAGLFVSCSSVPGSQSNGRHQDLSYPREILCFSPLAPAARYTEERTIRCERQSHR